MKTPVFAPAAAFLLLSTAGTLAFAQSGWPTDDAYTPQQQQPGYGAYQKPSPYANQQPGYADPQQPAYSNPQQSDTYGQQTYAQPGDGDQGYPQPNYAPQAPLNSAQIEQLAAPIALYPDALLAQILAASTYPAQISAADQWLRGLGYASPDQVAAAVNAQTGWDPSVKALTAYPQVLDQLSGNLQWTTALGNAYYNQPQDVMQAVQDLRQRAQQAGTLQSTPQEQVTEGQGYEGQGDEGQDYVAINPPSPQVVYVPMYNPWVVYGAPIAPYPGFRFWYGMGLWGGWGLHYGAGFALGAFNYTPFGLAAWGLDWLAHSILFHHADYYSRSPYVHDWGLPHGGPRAFRGGIAVGRLENQYHHEALPIHNGMGFNRGAGMPYTRPESSFGNRMGPGFNRGLSYTHPAMPQQQALNRNAAPIARPQAFDGRQQAYENRPQIYPARPQQYAPMQRPAIPANNFARPMQNFQGRQAFSAPQPSYRAPQSGYGRMEMPRQQNFAYARPEQSGNRSMFGQSHPPRFESPHVSAPHFSAPHVSAPHFSAPKGGSGGGNHGHHGR